MGGDLLTCVMQLEMMQNQLKALEELDDQWGTENERIHETVSEWHAKTGGS